MVGADLRRRLSKLKPKSRNMKGKDKGKEEANAPKKLFGNAQIEGYDQGYLTIRDAKLNYVSYANGREVVRGDEWGLVHNPPPPARSASVRGYHRVKSSVAESAQSLALILEQTAQAVHLPIGKSNREEREERVYEHNPIIVYGRPPSRMERTMEKSAALTNIVGGIKRLNFMKKDKPPHKLWDRRGEEIANLNEEQYLQISTWTEEQIAEYNEHNLVALTARQLKELLGKSVDNITYSNPIYMVPPSSPTLVDFYLDEEDEDEGDVFGRPDDEDPTAEHKYLHKDLRKLIGVYTGFHIAPGTGEAKMFDRYNNRSDYYGMPLIEMGRNHKREMVGLVNMVDQEFERYANVDYQSDDDDAVSDTSSDYDQTQNVLHRPRAQLPGQAMLLHLLYSGHRLNNVAKILGPLDPKFVYESESRWWKNYRVPQHTQLTDKICAKIGSIARAEKEWWEGERDTDGLLKGKRMPKEQVVAHSRMREKKVKAFAKKSVENYLWWRLRGETVHRDVKSGPMLRQGEY